MQDSTDRILNDKKSNMKKLTMHLVLLVRIILQCQIKNCWKPPTASHFNNLHWISMWHTILWVLKVTLFV